MSTRSAVDCDWPAGSKLQAPGLSLETGGCIYNQHLAGDQVEDGGVLAKATVEEHCVLCRLSQPVSSLSTEEDREKGGQVVASR